MFSRSAVAFFFAAAAVVKGQYTGDATLYNPGLDECGTYSSPSDYVVVIAAPIFDSYPGAGPNPNQNPICFKVINVNYQGKSVDATVVGRCAGCPGANIELSLAAFDALADPRVGRLHGVQWNYDS
ncbi:hypothetical protein FIBSPDRAFT_879297 [Athelia psychrophila]|uniref:Uncharacterized protein n=1 Tax=Athelia psychrophila TaxID=1759441 RepID=A0A167U545_9AGAM|nr:hypothetical protein FIBSPDRAFT_879297 [Fibularhizoctonia sp. CBS 109695]